MYRGECSALRQRVSDLGGQISRTGTDHTVDVAVPPVLVTGAAVRVLTVLENI